MKNLAAILAVFSVMALASFASADWYGSPANRGITGYAVAATATNSNDSTACSMPVCSGGSNPTDTGERDSTGCAIYKCLEPVIVTEQVKCVFNSKTGSSEGPTNECNGMGSYYTTADGVGIIPQGFGCTGVESCVADVKGPKGMAVTWKSSCGGYAYTTIDGDSEYANFYCDSPPNIVKETVKCVFNNSSNNNSSKQQECYGRNDSTGESFSCAGTQTCGADVSGAKGSSMTWKSSCGGYAYTTIDGDNEYANFYCKDENPKVEEEVRCVFDGATTEQKCYARGQSGAFFVCTGVGSCSTSVAGPKGEQLAWTSSCGGYANTTIDGDNETARFRCSGSPPSIVYEQVKCVFNTKDTTASSAEMHKCYAYQYDEIAVSSDVAIAQNSKAVKSAASPTVASSDIASTSSIYNSSIYNPFGCSGSETCVADVKGYKGTKLTWKSDCGGYAYTVIDGDNEYANFYCSWSPPPVEIVSEQVKCVFANNGSEGPTQKCYNTDYVGYPGAYCSGTETCVINVRGPKGKELNWASSCSGYASTKLDGESEYATFDCKPSRGGQTFTHNIATGWNLVSWPGYTSNATNTCDASAQKFFWYNKETGKYEKVAEPKLGTAYWLHNSAGPCTAKYQIYEPVQISSLPELGKGWNFVAIVPEMVGGSIESLGDCDLKSAYSYNAESRKWVPEIGKRITDSDLGKGFVVNSNNACSLAVASGPPPLPSETNPGRGSSGNSGPSGSG